MDDWILAGEEDRAVPDPGPDASAAELGRYLRDATYRRQLAYSKDESDRVLSRQLHQRARWMLKWDPELPAAPARAPGSVLGSWVKHPKLRSEMDAHWHTAGGRLFIGPSGIGKTSLLVHAVRTLLLRWKDNLRLRLPTTLFLRSTDLANARRGHQLGAGEAPLIKTAMDVDWLLLDDLGHDKFTDSTLFDVLDARYAAGNFTWATSGLPLADLEKLYDQATLRRILDGGGKEGVIVNCFKAASGTATVNPGTAAPRRRASGKAARSSTEQPAESPVDRLLEGIG